MKNNEKIGIAIIIILIIILAISIWAGKKTGSESKKINCEADCLQVGAQKWIFPGGGPQNFSATKDECISACESKVGNN